jgi:DNA-directed RNA polymerase specialized sigma24 family protein
MRSKHLRDAITGLPTGSRECIQLWLNEFTYDEIAKFLKITVDAVKSRLRDAKKILRARLGDANALPEVEE